MTDTATEAAAQRAAILTVSKLIAAIEYPMTLSEEEKYLSDIQNIIAPLVARSQAAERLAEAIDRAANDDERLPKYIFDAYRAYRALAEQEKE